MRASSSASGARRCRAGRTSWRGSSTRCWSALLLAVIVAISGALVFGAPLPIDRVPALVLIMTVGAAAFCSLGLAVAGLIPNAAAAPALVNAIVLPLYFVSDVFVQLDDDSPLALVGDLFPIRHLANALQSVWTPVAHPLDPVDLLWLAAWGVLGLVIALRTFTWEPRV